MHIKDLKAALVLEPGNESVKVELAKLNSPKAGGSAGSSKASPRRVENITPSSSSATAPTSTKPYRRRVPITIVDGPTSSKLLSINASSASHISSGTAASPGVDSLMSPVSSRSIKPTAHATNDPEVSSPSFATSGSKSQDPWVARDISGRRIGGGIIKKGAAKGSGPSSLPPSSTTRKQAALSGSKETAAPVVSHAVAQPTSVRPVPPLAPSNVLTSAKPTPRDRSPMSKGSVPTLFDFTRTWNMTLFNDDKWGLLKLVSQALYHLIRILCFDVLITT